MKKDGENAKVEVTISKAKRSKRKEGMQRKSEKHLQSQLENPPS